MTAFGTVLGTALSRVSADMSTRFLVVMGPSFSGSRRWVSFEDAIGLVVVVVVIDVGK